MTGDSPAKDRLRDLLTREGPGVLDDPARLRERLESLLPDRPEERRELLAAWRERIPQELLDLRGRPLSDLVRGELTHRLARRQDLPEERAAWSVGTWAAALGVRFAAAAGPADTLDVAPGQDGPAPTTPTPPPPAPGEVDGLLRLAQEGDVEAQVRLGHLFRAGQGVPADPREAVRWFSRAAKGGHPEAQCRLGLHLLEGSGVPRDYAKAREWFEQAARRNEAEAQFRLFQMDLEGKVVLGENEGMQWLQKAAASGHAQAQCLLGVWYYDHPAGDRDRQRAFHLLQKAARHDQPIAHLYLGRIHSTGEGGPRDVTMALRHFRAALDAGETDAGPALELLLAGLRTGELVAFGQQARDEGHADQAAYWWQRAADRGDPAAQKNLADLLLTGQGGRRDPALALALYRQAAGKGSAEAQFALAELHEKGEEVPRDLVQAYGFYAQAVRQGHPLANLRLDLLAEKVPPAGMADLARQAEKAGDEAQAFFWYLQGARRKEAGCCQAVGLLYKSGKGVIRDLDKAREWLGRAADLGLAEAWLHLGAMAAESRFPDLAQARDLFRRGAEQGNQECRFRLGRMHERGEGGPADGAAAAACFRQAAEAGHARAQFQLGLLLLQGRLVPADPEEAARWFRRAADQDFPPAHFQLGLMARDGHGLPPDPDQAARSLARAADLGDPDAQLQLGLLLGDRRWEGANPREAEKWLMKSAGKGQPAALHALGEMHLGRETFAEALEHFQRAAEQGHPPSEFRLGAMFADGHGVAPNPDKARFWLQKAADHGHPRAQARLGELLIETGGAAGQGATGPRGAPPRPTLPEAARLFQAAAAARDPVGLLRLAEMLLEGRGIPKDTTEAARLLQDAADQGHPPAQLLLGILYEEGTGVAADLIQAYKWYNLAAAALTVAAERRDALTRPSWMGFGRPRLLPPDEIEAQRLCREWKPKTIPPAR
ncbi:MAG: sel1 repeat family protein [Candidatus Riflebacteria bacterium]|nr:sel1 repeat family protein [Candidatus Riflebacteria bacterium]